jgi:hypothetical protein
MRIEHDPRIASLVALHVEYNGRHRMCHVAVEQGLLAVTSMDNPSPLQLVSVVESIERLRFVLAQLGGDNN